MISRSSLRLTDGTERVNSPDKPLKGLKPVAAESRLVELARLVSELASRPRRKDQRAVRAKSRFRGYPKVDALIRHVALADWDAARRATLQIVAGTDSTGRNESFAALLEYQDCPADDERLWSALHTIESCVTLAPWLIGHEQLSRMADHNNFSVRSSAACICLDLAQFAPDRVPLDILLKLSVHDEDWYVQTPANAAPKTMVRSSPGILQVFYGRLASKVAAARERAAAELADIAQREPQLLEIERLKIELARLRTIRDRDASKQLAIAISKSKGVRRIERYRYGF